ncbi:MAG: hypothetical protein GX889_07095 [Clostridiales bacterium]|nr:hypothetical protein [Clostridiales bacterium]
MSEIISAIIGFLSGFITKSTQDKSNYLKYITEERKLWRDKIRELTKELNETDNYQDYKRIMVEFEVRLNPIDPEDEKIIKLLEILVRLSKVDADVEGIKNELTGRIALLLKHDWERAKFESGTISFYKRSRAYILMIAASIILHPLISENPIIQYLKKLLVESTIYRLVDEKTIKTLIYMLSIIIIFIAIDIFFATLHIVINHLSSKFSLVKKVTVILAKILKIPVREKYKKRCKEIDRVYFMYILISYEMNKK